MNRERKGKRRGKEAKGEHAIIKLLMGTGMDD